MEHLDKNNAAKASPEARLAQSEAAILRIIEKQGLTEAFIDSVAKSKGIIDHYRDTPLDGDRTTGGEVESYLKSSLSNLVNDKFHRTSKQRAEVAALQSMQEAHGEAISEQPNPPALVADPQIRIAERELFEYRRAQSHHVLCSKEAKELGAEMPTAPTLSGAWAARVVEESYARAIDPQGANKLSGWPMALNDSRDRDALLGNPSRGTDSAFAQWRVAQKSVRSAQAHTAEATRAPSLAAAEQSTDGAGAKGAVETEKIQAAAKSLSSMLPGIGLKERLSKWREQETRR